MAATSSGLGQAVARALTAEGGNVVMFARRADAIAAAAAEVQAAAAPGAPVIGLTADVTRLADLERIVSSAVAEFGAVDVLSNNTGGPRPGMFDALTDDDWAARIRLAAPPRDPVDATLPAVYARSALGQGAHRYVDLGEAAITDADALEQPPKRGHGVGQDTPDQVAGDDITVNMLAPGTIDTDRMRQLNTDIAHRSGRSQDEVEHEALQLIPLRRYGTSTEFGACAAFLASEQAAYITGTTLLVDGGMFRGTY